MDVYALYVYSPKNHENIKIHILLKQISNIYIIHIIHCGATYVVCICILCACKINMVYINICNYMLYNIILCIYYGTHHVWWSDYYTAFLWIFYSVSSNRCRTSSDSIFDEYALIRLLSSLQPVDSLKSEPRANNGIQLIQHSSCSSVIGFLIINQN